MQTLEKVFHLQDAHTTVKRELIAALTTFVSLSYILFVNPNILHAAGIPKGAAFTVTALATAVGCFLMGFIANYPIALAPTLGSGAFFCLQRMCWDAYFLENSFSCSPCCFSVIHFNYCLQATRISG